MGIDLVCGMIVDEKGPPAKTSYQGIDYYFCAIYCKEAFEKQPQRFIEGVKKWGEALDPVCGMTVEISHAAAMSVYKGQFIYFCNISCKEKFDTSPEKFLGKREVPAIALSKATIRNIKQNLFWAFAYNAILIPVAAGILFPLFGILLNPIFAAAAMGLSSVTVVFNALRLKRFKPPMIATASSMMKAS